jgi:hypothetical protein
VERHYEIETNANYFLQYVYVTEEFYNNRFFHCLSHTSSLDLKNLLLEEYGSHTSYDDFNYLREISFTSFFRENAVDVPRCFSKSISLKRSVNEALFLKFNNYIMRHGKKLNTLKYLLSSLYGEFFNPLHFNNRTTKTTYS